MEVLKLNKVNHKDAPSYLFPIKNEIKKGGHIYMKQRLPTPPSMALTGRPLQNCAIQAIGNTPHA